MTSEDIKEFKRNAIKILEQNSQYATAKAVDIAFKALGCVEQFRWENEILTEQLKELGISFGQKIDGVYLSKEKYNELLEYKSMYESLCK